MPNLLTLANKRKFSLPLRVSSLLVLAVVVPLLITVLSGQYILRPTLIAQATTEMTGDAQQHSQQIDAYLVARLQELGFTSQFLAIRTFLAGSAIYRTQAASELSGGYHLNASYSGWALFDKQGNLRLYYPTPPQPRGNYVSVPPNIIQQLQISNTTAISNVYFDNSTRGAFVDLYTLIKGSDAQIVGIGRATLNLSTIWEAVNNEANAGTGNYAMVLDSHGVRIAYTNKDATQTTLPAALFKGSAPLSSQFQQQIKDENLYGNSYTPVSVVSDPDLIRMQQSANGATAFQATPAFQSEPFEVSSATGRILPWTYLVLRPVSTITRAADQQQWYLFLLAAVVAVLAALIGLLVGQGITRPILRSVTLLRDNSQSLRKLSSTEQLTAIEQKWIIESSQIGLQSVQYYASAASIAAQQLDRMSIELLGNWERSNSQQGRQRLNEIVVAARYIEKAAEHQRRSSNGLSDAMQVTAQVTEQLIAGATSAAEAATQLDEVVEQLRQVVGK